MTDLQIAKNNLSGHTICLCREGNLLISNERGIAPMMGFIADGKDLTGYAVADKVVGKAAALLFVKCGISGVFAETLSEGGRKVLEKSGIPYGYKTLAERIINREGTGVCPMEKAVENTCDPEEAYIILKDASKRLSAPKK